MPTKNTNTKNTKSPRRIRANEAGYIQIRITKKAHQELLRRALAEKRSLYAQLDIILGV